MREKSERHNRSLMAAVLALCMSVSASIGSMAQEAVAANMKLAAIEGTVGAANMGGRKITVLEGMRLYSGYRLTTEAASYAYITLDSVKAVKLDAVSEAEIRSKGKKQELLLNAGNLFFNVSEPLQADEALNIRTSTMVTGIRGTCGWVKKVDANVSRLYILEGHVICSVTNPITGRMENVSIAAGQTAVFTADGNGDVRVEIEAFTEYDVEGFVAAAIRDDAMLQQRIAQGGLFQVDIILGLADEYLNRDQAQAGAALADLADQLAGQTGSQSVMEVFPSGGSESGGGSGSGGAGTGEGTASARQMVQQAMPVTAQQLNNLLQTSDVTLTAPSGSGTLTIDSGVTVPAGGILDIGNGITTNIDFGQTLQVDGSLSAQGPVTNQGTIFNTSVNMFRANAGLTNTGTVTNTGRLIVGGIYNEGTFENQNILESSELIQNVGGSMTLGGTVTGNVKSSSPLTLSGNVTGNVNLTGSAQLTMTGGRVTDGVTLDNSTSMDTAGEFIMEGGIVERGTNNAAVYVTGSGNQKVQLYSGTVDGQDGVAVHMDTGTLAIQPDSAIRARESADLIQGTGEVVIEYWDSNGAIQEINYNSALIASANDTDGCAMAGIGGSLSVVLNEAEPGDTVVLNKDCTMDQDQTITAPLRVHAVVDLNGNRLTLDGGSSLYVGGGGSESELRIKDGKGSGEIVLNGGGSLYVEDSSVLILDGVKVRPENGSGRDGAPLIHSEGELTLFGKTTVEGQGCPAVELVGQSVFSIEEGVSITGEYTGGILLVQSAELYPEVYFNGGMIQNESYDGYAIEWNGDNSWITVLLQENPDGLGTKIQGKSSLLLVGDSDPLDLQEYGYEVVGSSEEYYELVPLANVVKTLLPYAGLQNIPDGMAGAPGNTADIETLPDEPGETEAPGESPEEEAPPVTEPGETETPGESPEEEVPSVTEPGETEPPGENPEEEVPPVTEPDHTEPEAAKPPKEDPEENDPPVTEPEGTEPPVTEPEGTESPETAVERS